MCIYLLNNLGNLSDSDVAIGELRKRKLESSIQLLHLKRNRR